jgi:serine/threonine-protein kinase
MDATAPLTLLLLDAGHPDQPVRGRIVCPGRLTVGRARSCGVVLDRDDHTASAFHFSIDLGPGHCLLLNESQHGTFVNSMLVHSQCDLRYGDLIRAGQAALRVELRRGDEPAELPSSVTVAYSQPPGLTTTVGPAPAAPGIEPPSALQFQGYRLIDNLGEGGMGTVWLAEDRAGRPVALKVIRPELALDHQTCTRFRRETAHLRDLTHPHIVGFRDSGEAGGLLYLVMEYVPGFSLGKLLEQQGPFAVGRAVRLTGHVLLALAYSHAAGVVHRDVKPSNILVTAGASGEEARLADFGLAKAYRSADVSAQVTLPGAMGGTFAFVAPDQLLDFRGAGPLADQYGVAATLYNVLTNRLPHEAATTVELLDRIRQNDAVPLSRRRADLPEGLVEVVHRALARDPRQRFPTITAFHQALQPFASA